MAARIRASLARLNTGLMRGSAAIGRAYRTFFNFLGGLLLLAICLLPFYVIFHFISKYW